MDNTRKDKHEFYLCNCFGELLEVTYWRDDKEFYISLWKPRRVSSVCWSQRLRHIWTILRTGEPWRDQIVLSVDNANKLSTFIKDQQNYEL